MKYFLKKGFDVYFVSKKLLSKFRIELPFALKIDVHTPLGSVHTTYT